MDNLMLKSTTPQIAAQASQAVIFGQLVSYEVHVMATQGGSLVLCSFEAWSDVLAQTIGSAYIDDYEKSTGDFIYRERLYRFIEGEEPQELPI